MSLIERVKMIARAEKTARNKPESKYGQNYVPFMGKLILDCVVDDAYKDLFLSAFDPNVKLDIGVMIDKSAFIAYNDTHGIETFLLELEYNSCIIEDVSDAPKDLYRYNDLNTIQITEIVAFINRQVEFRYISRTEAEGEVHAMIMVCSIMLLLDYVIDAVLTDLQLQQSLGVDISEIPLPYPIDLKTALEEDMNYEFMVEMNGIAEYAENLEIPVYPPFSPQMQGVRQNVLDYIEGLSQEWHQLFLEAFQKAEQDYVNVLGRG